MLHRDGGHRMRVSVSCPNVFVEVVQAEVATQQHSYLAA